MGSEDVILEDTDAVVGEAPSGQVARLERLVERFRRFIPEELVERVSGGMAGDASIPLDCVIFFADVRSFTALSQRLDAEEVASFLDRLYRVMQESIAGQSGVVDKFLGDGVMALFDGPDAEDRAVRSALALQDGLRRYNLLEKPECIPAVEMGIGIHAGRVRLGVLGDRRRATATVIGDAVNVAKRIEGMTKRFRAKVIVSGAVACRLRGAYHRREIDTLQVRGRDEPVQLHEIYDCDPAFIMTRKDGTREDLARALELYKSRRFAEALEAFGVCFRRHMSDGAILDHLHRCHHFLRHPPGPDWRGGIVDEPLIDWRYRRRYRRQPRAGRVLVWSGLKHRTRRRMDGQMVDCSLRGMRLLLPEFVRQADALLLDIPPEDGRPQVSLGGRVVWCAEHMDRPPGQRVSAGVEVVGLGAGDERLYRERVVDDSASAPAHPRVLVVDDDPVILRMTGIMLPRLGYTVVALREPAALQDHLAAHPCHLVLLDLHMPGLDGRACLERLRQDPLTADLPVIMMTGDDDEDNVRRCFCLGADDFIQKPLSAPVLEARIRAALRASTARTRANEQLLAANLRLKELVVRAEAASRAKSDFLDAVNHEFRTPLAGVTTAGEILAGADLPAGMRDVLDGLRRSCSRLHEVVESVLEHVHTDAGRPGCRETEFDLHADLAELADQQALRLCRSDTTFTMEYVPPGPVRVRTDREKIRQIAANLLANAFQHSESGQVLLRLEALSRLPGRIIVRLTVEDTGIGLDEPGLRSLFEPIPRMDFGGSDGNHRALGLVICRMLAQDLGGELLAESAPGRGSRFWLDLSLAPAEDAPRESSATPVVSTPPPRQDPPVLLLVEDDSEISMLTRILLRRIGVEAELATDGREALEMVQRRHEGYDLILMDVQMPVMDGLEATRRIRDTERQHGQHTPIVALTAFAEDAYRERCLAAGMDDFLQKPATGPRLAEVIRVHTGWTAAAATARSP